MDPNIAALHEMFLNNSHDSESFLANHFLPQSVLILYKGN